MVCSNDSVVVVAGSVVGVVARTVVAGVVVDADVVVVGSIVVVGLSVVVGDVAAGADGVVDETWPAFDDPQAANVNAAAATSAKARIVGDVNGSRVCVLMDGVCANPPRGTSPMWGSRRV